MMEEESLYISAGVIQFTRRSIMEVDRVDFDRVTPHLFGEIVTTTTMALFVRRMILMVMNMNIEC
jgi:hypothetical protein